MSRKMLGKGKWIKKEIQQSQSLLLRSLSVCLLGTRHLNQLCTTHYLGTEWTSQELKFCAQIKVLVGL